MLTAYYSKGADSSELFSHLEIGSSPDFEKHLNKYDVIHFDVQSFLELAGKPEKVVSLIKRQVIRELKEYYPSYVDSKEESLLNALAEINNKFIVIIDEWDVLICDDANNIHLGYLGYNQKKKTAFIPNEEIRQEMGYAVESNPWKEMIAFLQESESILDETLNLNAKKVAEGIEKIHAEYASTIKYNDENSLSNVLTLAYLASMDRYFKPIRELPAGRGFADFVYLPKPNYKEDYPALVVELKWNKDARTALNQIKEKNYPNSIKDFTDNSLLVGLNYDKTTKKHECLIEKL